MERVKGIEPSQPAWKAGALPLSYTRIAVKWSEQQDSNLRPPGPKPGALPNCAMPRYILLHVATHSFMSLGNIVSATVVPYRNNKDSITRLIKTCKYFFYFFVIFLSNYQKT